MSQLANRVWETSSVSGTGTAQLSGAVAGYRTVVAGHGNGSTVEYGIEHTTTAEWEYGEGVVTDATPDTLTRVTVWSSSNGGSLVNFSAGTKNVFCSPPGQKIPLLHVANVWTANQTISSTSPSLILTDTTASAKSLTIAVDADKADFRESADGAGSLLQLDLSTRRVMIRNSYLSLWGWTSSNTDIDGLIPGTTFGGIIEGASSGHLVLGLRENDVNDGVYVISGGGNYAVDGIYDTLVLAMKADGNIGLGTATFGTSGTKVLGILNGVAPTTSPADMIQLYSKDSSAGAVNATLGLQTEQAVETIGTFTASHKLRLWINNVEYYIQLDAV